MLCSGWRGVCVDGPTVVNELFCLHNSFPACRAQFYAISRGLWPLVQVWMHENSIIITRLLGPFVAFLALPFALAFHLKLVCRVLSRYCRDFKWSVMYVRVFCAMASVKPVQRQKPVWCRNKLNTSCVFCEWKRRRFDCVIFSIDRMGSRCTWIFSCPFILLLYGVIIARCREMWYLLFAHTGSSNRLGMGPSSPFSYFSGIFLLASNRTFID